MRPAAGTLLVATPRLLDPNFVRTVVYLVDHDDAGSLGLIVNRPLDIPLDAIWDEAPATLADHRIAAQGGPVEPNKGILLHGDLAVPGCLTMCPGVAAGGQVAAITARWADGPDRFGPRLFLGTSGWGPGQLDNEVEQGSWIVRAGTSDLLLDLNPPDSLWQQLVDGGALDTPEPSEN
jgi:putative transcriptional regulator